MSASEGEVLQYMLIPVSLQADDESGDALSPRPHPGCPSCPSPPAEPRDAVAVWPAVSRSPFACGPESFLSDQRRDPTHRAVV